MAPLGAGRCQRRVAGGRGVEGAATPISGSPAVSGFGEFGGDSRLQHHRTA